MASVIIILAFCIQLASAHFRVLYPFWRGDSLKTQWNRPCGGVNVTTNRTQWPLDGGSVVFTPGHPWAITYVNLGLGSDDAVVFNISLVHGFNQTGNGTYCFPKIALPKNLNVSAGTNASIQVIQITELGSALFNCADITFSPDAMVLASDKCTNSTGIGSKPLEAAECPKPANATTNSTANSIFAVDHIPFKLRLGATLVGLLGPWLV